MSRQYDVESPAAEVVVWSDDTIIMRSVTGRSLKDDELRLIHGVCHWRLQKESVPRPCRNCPLSVDTAQGPGIPGCVKEAQELIALVRRT